MDNIKKHPAWKNAYDIILERFSNEGYGILFSDEEIHDILDLDKPAYGSFQNFQKFQLEKLSQLESLKTALLENDNLYFENVRGIGYRLVHPNDQVTKSFDTLYKTARRRLSKAMAVVTHVDNTLLSADAKLKQIENLNRAAWVKSHMNRKRKIPAPDTKLIA